MCILLVLCGKKMYARAVHQSLIASVTRAVTNTIVIHPPDTQGGTPLHVAAEGGSEIQVSGSGC